MNTEAMNEANAKLNAGGTSWDALDMLPASIRTVDSVDLEMELACTAELRSRVLALGTPDRDELRLALQRKATERTFIDAAGHRKTLRLMAAPVVLSFEEEASVTIEPKLFRDGDTRLPQRWREIWARLVPGARVIPATSCILLDEVLGASPDSVHACLQAGVAFLRGGPRPALRLGLNGQSTACRYKSAEGPIAATYLAMAYVVCSEGDLIDEPEPGALHEAAELLQAIFSTRREVPRVNVLAPTAFYDAMNSATAVQMRHFVDWGDRNYPSWSLDMVVVDGSTRMEVTGSYAGEEEEGTAPGGRGLVRWIWDRVWWTDQQIQALRLQVDDGDLASSPTSTRPSGSRAFFVAVGRHGTLQ